MPDPTHPYLQRTTSMSSKHRATNKQWWLIEDDDSSQCASCILELRARVEALEAAANNRQHGEAAERAEPDPAASLVERVRQAQGCGNERDARAAIREVAEWLRSEYPKHEGYGTSWASLIEEETNR